MFNIGSGEIVFIAVAALLILGPKRLPELARGLGKFMREFRRQTDEVRNVVEREFYKMDEELDAPIKLTPAEGNHSNSLPVPDAHTLNALPHAGDLPQVTEPMTSQLTAGTRAPEAPGASPTSPAVESTETTPPKDPP